MKKNYLLILLCVLSFNGFASHIHGGHIGYEWLTGKTYVIKMVLYTDCQGLIQNSVQLTANSDTCASNFQISMALHSLEEVPYPYCDDLSICNGGTVPGINKLIYLDTVSMPIKCADWVFSYTDCCRPPNVSNLKNPSQESFYIEALLNNSDVAYNNSPVLNSSITAYLKDSASYGIDWSVLDFDGDNIVYRLIPSLGANGLDIAFQSPYTLNDPFLMGDFVLDTIYGQTAFTVGPSANYYVNINYRVEEYRRVNSVPVLIAWTTYSLPVFVLQNKGNKLPSMTGVDSTNDYSVSVCAGDTLTFSVWGNDINANTLEFEIIDSLTGMTFSSSGQNPIRAKITWEPQQSDVQAYPHTLTLALYDDTCRLNGSSQSYQIFVTNCDTGVVWPGDTDNDRSVGVWDVLPIGVAYSNTGPARTQVNGTFMPQPSLSDWPKAFNNGLNYKYGDCNGDGVIDSLDVTIVGQNMYKNHPTPPQLPPLFHRALNADLFLENTDTFVLENQYFEIPIHLGRSGMPKLDAYGIAFSINYDPSLIKSIGIDPTISSWLTASMSLQEVNSMSLNFRDDSLGRLDFVISRNDGNSMSGLGEIAKMIVIMEENIAGNILSIDVDNVAAVDYQGAFLPIQSYGLNALVLDDTLITNVSALDLKELSLFPNPSNGKLFIKGAKNTKLRMYNLLGECYMVKEINQNVDIHSLEGIPQGIYILEFSSSQDKQTKKLILQGAN